MDKIKAMSDAFQKMESDPDERDVAFEPEQKKGEGTIRIYAKSMPGDVWLINIQHNHNDVKKKGPHTFVYAAYDDKTKVQSKCRPGWADAIVTLP